jgi:exodeoxyribonuclease-3
MKIISWNVNGLKSIFKKGLLEFLEKENPDILCLQEIKFQSFFETKIKNYFAFFNCAKRKGLWGVAVFTKRKPIKVERNFGFKRVNDEGRFLKLDFKDFSLINVYLPHGGRKKENLGYKLRVFKELRKYLKKSEQKNIILAGDFNVAHTELDLARPKENKNNIMFLPQERTQIDKILKLGFLDTFRHFHKEEKVFTWWLRAFDAKKRDIGWRIDYIFVSKRLTSKLKDAFVLRDVKGSDHCPIGVEFNDL